MKTQNKDRTVQSEAEMTRSKRVREAAEKSFTPNNNSVWVLLGVLFPFLMPLIRLVAHKAPDKHLVNFYLSLYDLNAADIVGKHNDLCLPALPKE